MHEWDIAASKPCPFCCYLSECPHVATPQDECLELWPLGRPRHRALQHSHPIQRHWNSIALANGDVADIVEHWRGGEQVTDEQYLLLRHLAYSSRPAGECQAYGHVLSSLLTPKAGRYLSDACAYYNLDPAAPEVHSRMANYLRGGVIVANEFMVTQDKSVVVPSRFERIVFEVLKIGLWALSGKGFLKCPKSTYSFRRMVESEWREVLYYGNGFYGFTVHPRVHLDDLVRYQELGGGDDLVSWSISNWVIWSMTAFPSIVETVARGFSQKALGERLVRMYEPLVQAYAGRLMFRAKLVYPEDRRPKRTEAVEELRALLRSAIEKYHFGYGKPDAMLSSVGAVGPASSPELRGDLHDAFRDAGLPFSVSSYLHVGFTCYLKGKFHEHLRDSYPWYDPAFGEVDQRSGAIVEGESEAADAFRDETSHSGSKSDVGSGVRPAHEKAGIQYFYIDQMAFLCGPEISATRLENWDRRGDLKALRMRDIDPGAPATIANRRVYPYTEEMLSQIKTLADRKEMLQADPQEGVLSRQQAADRLGISTRALGNWRREGKIAEVKIEHRVFIPEAEVEKLLADRSESQ